MMVLLVHISYRQRREEVNKKRLQNRAETKTTFTGLNVTALEV